MQANLSSSFSNKTLTLKLLKTVSYSLPAYLSPFTQIPTSPPKKLHRSLGYLQYVSVGQTTHTEFRKITSWRTLLYWTNYIQNDFFNFQSILAFIYNLSWLSTTKYYKITTTVKPFSPLILFPSHTSTNNSPEGYLFSLCTTLLTAISSPPGLSTRGHL